MKMMYISHPFTGNEKENAAGAKRVKKALQLAYPNICFVNPLDEFGDNDKLDYCAALSLAMELLSRCDGVIFCRNWEKSTGCKAEMAYAKKAGMEIKYLSNYGITADGAVSESDTEDAESKNKEPYIVYWGGACIGFSSYPIYPSVYVAPEINLTNDNLKNIVIVGNVYENPEIARCQKLEDIYAQKERPFKAKKFRSCPFCWSDNVDLENDEGIWFVKCEDCGAQGGNAYRPENAIAMWNNNLKSKGDDR
ncbi:MAG: DUF4406 domain-containing protein [Selenomonadaceae bacterium]|nr:DUF4406 domain-containing protein [Selenomonadaceae bacterium]